LNTDAAQQLTFYLIHFKIHTIKDDPKRDPIKYKYQECGMVGGKIFKQKVIQENELNC